MATEDPSTETDAPARDLMSPTKRRQLQQCFERGNELTKKAKPDYDYAHDLYSQCVAVDPGNLVYVEAMLDNLQRKFGNNKKGSRFKGFGGRKAFNAAVEDEDWPDVFREGLDLLKVNPWDVATLRGMANACAINRYNEVELRYLKNALDGKPTDPDVNKHCAQSLARMGQFDMAISCWNRVAEKNKKAEEPQRMISELTMAKTMGVPPSAEALGNLGPREAAPQPATEEPDEAADNSASDELVTDADAPEGTEDAGDSRTKIKLNVRQQLERDVEENPTVVENYLKLADLHTDERRYQDAEKILQRAISATGASLNLQTALEDTRIRSAKARVAIAERRAASNKTDEAKELTTQLRSDLNRLELDIYQSRVQRFPDNKRGHYELGLRLRRAGNHLEAIKSYDLARSDSAIQVAATLEMGECWQQLKQYTKALKCYEVAIQKSTAADGDRRKLALYRGGVLASALKQPEEARGWLTELVAMDADYKDASARLDKLG